MSHECGRTVRQHGLQHWWQHVYVGERMGEWELSMLPGSPWCIWPTRRLTGTNGRLQYGHGNKCRSESGQGQPKVDPGWSGQILTWSGPTRIMALGHAWGHGLMALGHGIRSGKWFFVNQDQLWVPPVHFRYGIYFRAHVAESE